MKHIYIYEEENGTQKGVYSGRVINDENMKELIKLAENRGCKYNVIEDGKIIDTNTTEERKEDTMNTTEAIITAAENTIETRPQRGAWAKGVTAYALELLEGLKESISGGWFDPEDLRAPKLVEKELLNGASDWNQYSWGGSSLIYDRQIAERLCNKTELKITRNGERNPNKREQWLDTQARALYQAGELVKDAIRTAAANI